MDLQEVMQQAQEMQEKLSKMQEAMETEEAEGDSGGGAVKVTMNGKGLIQRIEFVDKSMLSESNAEILADLVMAASNSAKDKIEQMYNERMAQIAGDMGLPPGLNVPS